MSLGVDHLRLSLSELNDPDIFLRLVVSVTSHHWWSIYLSLLVTIVYLIENMESLILKYWGSDDVDPDIIIMIMRNAPVRDVCPVPPRPQYCCLYSVECDRRCWLCGCVCVTLTNFNYSLAAILASQTLRRTHSPLTINSSISHKHQPQPHHQLQQLHHHHYYHGPTYSHGIPSRSTKNFE